MPDFETSPRGTVAALKAQLALARAEALKQAVQAVQPIIAYHEQRAAKREPGHGTDERMAAAVRTAERAILALIQKEAANG